MRSPFGEPVTSNYVAAREAIVPAVQRLTSGGGCDPRSPGAVPQRSHDRAQLSTAPCADSAQRAKRSWAWHHEDPTPANHGGAYGRALWKCRHAVMPLVQVKCCGKRDRADCT